LNDAPLFRLPCLSSWFFDEFVGIVDAFSLDLNGENRFLQNLFFIDAVLKCLIFRSLHQMNFKTGRSWRIKEDFIEFWRSRYTAAAQRYLDVWVASAMRSRLEPVIK